VAGQSNLPVTPFYAMFPPASAGYTQGIDVLLLGHRWTSVTLNYQTD
jgi:hypothetical protein